MPKGSLYITECALNGNIFRSRQRKKHTVDAVPTKTVTHLICLLASNSVLASFTAFYYILKLGFFAFKRVL